MIEFNRETTVALKLTDSAPKITAALDTAPSITTGTHIYDAVAQAEAMLSDANISSGSIIVLSDGADTGSTNPCLGRKGCAQRRTRGSTPSGSMTSSYNPAHSRRSQRQDMAQYEKATPQQLPALRRSESKPFGRVSPAIQVPRGAEQARAGQSRGDGLGTAPSGYRTPPSLVHNAVPGTYNPSIGTRIWSSAITMIVLALLAAGVVAFLVIGLSSPGGVASPHAWPSSSRSGASSATRGTPPSEDASGTEHPVRPARRDARDRRHPNGA